MEAKKFLRVIINFIIPTTLIGCGVGYISNQAIKKWVAKQRQTQYKELLPFLQKTSDGIPLTFEPKGEITVGLSLSKEEAKQATMAIQQIDDISDTLNYKIIDIGDKSISCDINITQAPGLNYSDAMGVTNLSYDGMGNIKLPISIQIATTCIDYYSQNGVNLCNYVVKHEMLHTLCFDDLQDSKYYQKSCMWWSINNGDCDDITELDKKNIKKLYDNKDIVVDVPKNVNFITYIVDKQKPKEEPELSY